MLEAQRKDVQANTDEKKWGKACLKVPKQKQSIHTIMKMLKYKLWWGPISPQPSLTDGLLIFVTHVSSVWRENSTISTILENFSNYVRHAKSRDSLSSKNECIGIYPKKVLLFVF